MRKILVCFILFLSLSFSKTDLIVHYEQKEDLGWDLWIWPKDKGGSEYKFSENDEFGKVAKISFEEDISEAGFLVRLPDWSKKDVEKDRYVKFLDNKAEIWLKSGDENIYYKEPVVAKENESILTVHYEEKEDLGWDLWIWPKGLGGSEYKFSKQDDFGRYARIKFNERYEELGIIVRLPDWSKKDVEKDRYVKLENGVSEIWLKSNDEKIYYENPYSKGRTYDKVTISLKYLKEKNSKNEIIIYSKDKKEILKKDLNDGENILNIEKKGIDTLLFKIRDKKTKKFDFDYREIKNFDRSGNVNFFVKEGEKSLFKTEEEALKTASIKEAKIDKMNEISIKLDKEINLNKISNDLKINNGVKVLKIESIKGKNTNSDYFKLILNKDLDLTKEYILNSKTLGKVDILIGNVVKDDKFDEIFYTNEELGNIYSKEKTTFKVWSPVAKEINLITFVDGKEVKYKMDRSKKGVYSYTLKGDMQNLEYLYEVKIGNNVERVVDPYAKAVSINGEKGVVSKMDFVKIQKLEKVSKNPIIYELHVRDLSISEDSGIKNKGKFLGLTELDSKYLDMKTGLSYIKDLGITHIQLLPIYDYSKYSVDETKVNEKFNWGYDPVNYNAVEGSYSTNPYSPTNRIKELQILVDVLHKNNLGLIMDVVYNHVFSATEHSFNKLVPNYYFRLDENGNFANGTGVGNDVASEKKMVRKFIIDSAKHWIKTYSLDGFRFDLMGILDVKTMNELKKEARLINPNFFILGEGWDMGSYDKDKKAAQINADKLEGIAFFNDDLRDAAKGSTFGFIGKGFASSKVGEEKRLLNSILGAKGVKAYISPKQLIQYVEAHDNMTLFDQLLKTNGDESYETLVKRHNLATGIVLLSQGHPFLHAGQEFLRTKKGDENSYKSSDEINRLDWKRAYDNKENIEFVKKLIDLRKTLNIFDMESYSEIEKRIEKIKAEDLMIYYIIDGKYNIVLNANFTDKEIKVENGIYEVLIKGKKVDKKGIETIEVKDGKIRVDGISILMLKKI